MTKSGMPKCKGRNRRNCNSNRNMSNKWKMKVVHEKHIPNFGIGPKLLSHPRILHSIPRIIKGNVITQFN